MTVISENREKKYYSYDTNLRVVERSYEYSKKCSAFLFPVEKKRKSKANESIELILKDINIPYKLFQGMFRELFLGFGESFADQVIEIALNTKKKNIYREEELSWLSLNSKKLVKYAGKWICVEKSKLVSSNEKLDKVLETVKKLGINKPFVYFVPTEPNKALIGS